MTCPTRFLGGDLELDISAGSRWCSPGRGRSPEIVLCCYKSDVLCCIMLCLVVLCYISCVDCCDCCSGAEMRDIVSSAVST